MKVRCNNRELKINSFHPSRCSLYAPINQSIINMMHDALHICSVHIIFVIGSTFVEYFLRKDVKISLISSGSDRGKIPPPLLHYLNFFFVLFI